MDFNKIDSNYIESLYKQEEVKHSTSAEITKLPNDILLLIINALNVKNTVHLSLVNKGFYALTRLPVIWQTRLKNIETAFPFLATVKTGLVAQERFIYFYKQFSQLIKLSGELKESKTQVQEHIYYHRNVTTNKPDQDSIVQSIGQIIKNLGFEPDEFYKLTAPSSEAKAEIITGNSTFEQLRQRHYAVFRTFSRAVDNPKSLNPDFLQTMQKLLDIPTLPVAKEKSQEMRAILQNNMLTLQLQQRIDSNNPNNRGYRTGGRKRFY